MVNYKVDHYPLYHILILVSNISIVSIWSLTFSVSYRFSPYRHILVINC